jgi:hypothetical protein
MQFRFEALQALILGVRRDRGGKRRRMRQVTLACDSLEDRVTPAHGGFAHHAVSHLQTAAHHGHATASVSTTSASTSVVTASGTTTAASQSTTDSDSSTTDSSSSSSSAVSTAEKTLRSDIQTIELASGTTAGQLTAIAVAFEKLRADGLAPSSQSALRSFENTLVTDFASGTTLTGNTTLLSQFEALYASSPTTQESTDLTAAYNALAASVTSSNITSADITTINTDWAAVLAAEGSTSTASFPYFQLVTGQQHGPGSGGFGQGAC